MEKYLRGSALQLRESGRYCYESSVCICGFGAANGRWPHILSALGINVPSARRHGACPACGGKDRFRLDDKDGRGTWFCNQCGNGDGLDLVRLVTGRSVKVVAGMVSEVLALPEVQDKPAMPAVKKTGKRDWGRPLSET